MKLSDFIINGGYMEPNGQLVHPDIAPDGPVYGMQIERDININGRTARSYQIELALRKRIADLEAELAPKELQSGGTAVFDMDDKGKLLFKEYEK